MKQFVLLTVSVIKEEQIPGLIRQGNDKEVLNHLYKKVLPLVKRYILNNNGNNEDAHDIFHDVLMLFYEQVVRGEFDEKYKAFGYIYRICMFRWINKCKKDKNIQLSEELPEIAEEQIVDRSYDPVSGEERNIIKELFSNIGDKCVELLTYSIYSNMLMEDIMVRMGMNSVDATRMQQMRCKKKLMKEIEKNPKLINKLRGL